MNTITEYQFIYQKPSYIPVRIILLGLIAVFFALFTIYSYDEVISSSLITCTDKCHLSIEQLISTDNNYEYIVLDNQKYSIDAISFEEPYFNEVYQDIVQKINIDISLDSTKYHNRVKKIKLLHNRQRTIKRIIQKII